MSIFEIFTYQNTPTALAAKALIKDIKEKETSEQSTQSNAVEEKVPQKASKATEDSTH